MQQCLFFQCVSGTDITLYCIKAAHSYFCFAFTCNAYVLLYILRSIFIKEINTYFIAGSNFGLRPTFPMIIRYEPEHDKTNIIT